MRRVATLLRAPLTALSVIGFIGAWTAAGAWAPWARGGGAPAWATAIGLARPFTSWPFLAAVALLFASTLACTWGKRARIAALRRGELPRSAVLLPAQGADVRAFLASQGFRGGGDLLVRHGAGLWGGWVLHVGLLVLIAAVLVQQAFADSGSFDLSEREVARLDAPGIVFGRERGPLARDPLPPIEVRLEEFDPALRQPGYAPDRRSRLSLSAPGEERVVELDRAAGVRVGGVEIFQAIPTGLTIVIDVPGMGTRGVRLSAETPRRAAATVTDPAGAAARFVVETERPIDDPTGIGRSLAWLEREGRRAPIAPGATFAFGHGEARALGISRWGRFTWSRTPGLGAVQAGFALLLAGSLLLLLPAGVARPSRPGENGAALVFTVRGAAALVDEWRRAGDGRAEG